MVMAQSLLADLFSMHPIIHAFIGDPGDGDLPGRLPPGSPPTQKFEGPWFTTQLVISGTLGLTSFLLFSYCRTRWPIIFAPRTKLKGFSPHEAHAHQAFFGWIMPTLRTSEFTVLQIVGLDAAVLLSFFKMSFYLFSVCSLFAMMILMPLNWKHNKEIDADSPFPDDDDDWPAIYKGVGLAGRSFMANDSNRNNTYPFPGRDWLDLINDANSYLSTQLMFTYTFTILALYFIHKNYRRFIRSRQLFSLELVHSIPARTVLVTKLPRHLQNERKLAEYFEQMDLSVESVTICREVGSLKALLDKRTAALLDLERAWVDYVGNPSTVGGYDPEAGAVPLGDGEVTDVENGQNPQERVIVPHRKRPTLRPGLFSREVDALEYLESRFKIADEAVKQKRKHGKFRATETAFVTFEKMSSAQVALQSACYTSPNQCRTYPAPEPRDIVWANMTPTSATIRSRDVFVLLTMVVLLLFWIFPITALASLLSYKEIKKAAPWLGKMIDQNDRVRALVQNSLPSVAMITLNALLPFFLEALTYLQGYRARSWVEYSLMKKYFLFLLINVVFIFLVATTYWQLVRDLANSPAKVPEKLAIALQAGRARHFFLSYVILQALGIMPLQLLNLGIVIPRIFYKMFLTRTPRDYAELNAPPMINYGVVYPQAILMFVITMLYSVVQPLILVFGAVYFGMAYIVYKYKLLFVFYKPYESQGQAWPITFVRLIWGIAIFLLFMTGIFTLRKAWFLSSLLVPLLAGTCAWAYYIYRLFKPLSKYVALSSVFEVERGEESTDVVRLRYAHPVTWSQSNLSRRRYAQNDETLYVAPEDERTDYSQPPMANWYSGVLNTGKRRYGHPALNGVLPQPWLPLKKGQTLVNGINGVRPVKSSSNQAVVLNLRNRSSYFKRGGKGRAGTNSNSLVSSPLVATRPVDLVAVGTEGLNPWEDARSRSLIAPAGSGSPIPRPNQDRRINSPSGSNGHGANHRLSYDHATGIIMLPDDGDWLMEEDEIDSDHEHDDEDTITGDRTQNGGDARGARSGTGENSELASASSSVVDVATSSTAPGASRVSRYGTYFHHPERRSFKPQIPGAFPPS